MAEYTVREFLREGSSPFADWFTDLDSTAASKVTTGLYRLEQGNFSNVQSVILLCGGTKKTQQKDIDRAKDFWQEYKARKKSGGYYGAYP